MPETTPHILVIDDNDDILQMLKAMLNMKAYAVSTKNNIDPASLKELAPDIIIMDMLLSGVDGREVCKSLKADEEFSHIPIIMISAHPQAGAECLEAGANYFLEKPFDIKDIFKTIAEALKQH